MATVNSYTSDRIQEIENGSIVDASVDPDTGDLILTKFDTTTYNVGVVVGATGAAGVSGAIAVDDLEDVPPGTPAGTPIFLRG
jgi:hypothetical protein